jgi:ABC-2 type transport system permease protein
VDPALPALQPYGGNWFSYVVLGYAPLEFLRVGVFGFSSSVREAQSHGTLEALLVTRAGVPTIIFGSVAYAYLRAAVRAALFVTMGIAVAGFAGRADFGAGAAFLLLSVICFGAIGVLSASFVMVFKRGDPISMLIVGTSTLFSGLFFPPQLLGRLEVVSRFLPLTYAMEGVRQAANGRSLRELWPELAMLALFCAVLVPLAAWAFRAAIDRARRDGTLGQY